MSLSSLLLLLLLLTPASPALPGGQEGGAEPVPPAGGVLRQLHKLRTEFTDWSLLRDVCDRVRARGRGAAAVIRRELRAPVPEDELLRTKYRIRLHRVLAGLDPEAALTALAGWCRHEDEDLACFAARLIGRSGAPPDLVAGTLVQAFRDEKCRPIRDALLCAMAHCGDSSLFPFLEKLLAEGKMPRGKPLHLRYWAQVALATCAPRKALRKARKWLTKKEDFRLAAILIAKKYHDRKCEAGLVEICREWRDEHKERALVALGALAGEKGLACVLRMRREKISRPDTFPPEEGMVQVFSSEVDPALWPLLRLSHPLGLAWADKAVKLSKQFSAYHQALIPELVGAWRLPQAREMLLGWAGLEHPPGEASLFGPTRVRIGRGLCRLEDPRGLEVLAGILEDERYRAEGLWDSEVLVKAQQALHDFTADPDRPEYTVLGQGKNKEEKRRLPARVGRAWRDWLQEKGRKVRWRTPRPNIDSLVEVY